MPAIPPLTLPGWSVSSSNTHTQKNKCFFKIECDSRISVLRGLCYIWKKLETKQEVHFMKRNLVRRCVSLCVLFFNSLTSLYIFFFLFLCLLVPSMPQSDPGLGGIISYRQRVGSEIWDCICQRWQVRFTVPVHRPDHIHRSYLLTHTSVSVCQGHK